MPSTEFIMEIALYDKGKIAVRFTDGSFLVFNNGRLKIRSCSSIRSRISFSRRTAIPLDSYLTSSSWLYRCLSDRATFTSAREFVLEYIKIISTSVTYYHNRKI